MGGLTDRVLVAQYGEFVIVAFCNFLNGFVLVLATQAGCSHVGHQSVEKEQLKLYHILIMIWHYEISSVTLGFCLLI